MFVVDLEVVTEDTVLIFRLEYNYRLFAYMSALCGVLHRSHDKTVLIACYVRLGMCASCERLRECVCTRVCMIMCACVCVCVCVCAQLYGTSLEKKYIHKYFAIPVCMRMELFCRVTLN